MLTEVACRKARAEAAPRKLTDSHGLYLLVRPSGSKTWCWKYRVGGREKKLVIGPYPLISLKAAREERDRARTELAGGRDPGAEKQKRKAAAALAALDSFEKVARAWHAAKSLALSPRYAASVMRRLEMHAFPALGRWSVREITPPMVLQAIRAIEARGTRHMAHKVRNHISEVFVWAIASGLADQDPAAVIKRALEPMDPRLRPALVRLAQARAVLVETEKLPMAHWSTLLASRLLALTAARPGVVRLAERGEFEGLGGRNPIWRIPAAKMKLTRARKRDVTYEFVVPLSHQAVAVVQAAMRASPCMQSSGPRWLFPGIGDLRTPITDSTLSKLYRDAGLRGRHVPHGWRSTFSTIMNERAAVAERDGDRAIIDMMLAHMQEGVEPIYNRAAYMPRRREIAQDWADLLMANLQPPEALLTRTRGCTAGEAAHDVAELQADEAGGTAPG